MKTNAYSILMKLKKIIEIFNDIKCQATFGFEYIIQIIHSVRHCMFCVFHEVCKCFCFVKDPVDITTLLLPFYQWSSAHGFSLDEES